MSPMSDHASFISSCLVLFESESGIDAVCCVLAGTVSADWMGASVCGVSDVSLSERLRKEGELREPPPCDFVGGITSRILTNYFRYFRFIYPLHRACRSLDGDESQDEDDVEVLARMAEDELAKCSLTRRSKTLRFTVFEIKR